MCTYQFKKHPLKRCPLYHSEKHINENLPLDKQGRCLFHSKTVTFKLNFDIKKIFEQTLTWLDKQGSLTYDFRETRMGYPGYRLVLDQLGEDKPFNFSNAIFFSDVTFQNCTSTQRIEFDQVEFKEGLRFLACQIHEIDLSYSTFVSSFVLEDTIINKHLILLRTFHLRTSALIIRRSKFEGLLTAFESEIGGVLLQDSDFKNKLNFEGATISRQLIVSNCTFEKSIDFINTNFKITERGIHDRYYPIDFNAIALSEQVVLTFKGQKPQTLFEAETSIRFLDDVCNGKVQFKNTDLSYLEPDSKIRLFDLARSGKVLIGTGCLKYRHQRFKTIPLDTNNQNLAVELSQTFTRFFEQFNGLNLGVEIEERRENYIKLFYFSDEDISTEVFRTRLELTEMELWGLVGKEINTNNTLPSLADKVLTKVDALVDLTGTFFKICARIPLGKIREADLNSLLHTTSFGEKSVLSPQQFQQVLVKNYTQTVLFGINNQQLIKSEKDDATTSQYK